MPPIDRQLDRYLAQTPTVDPTAFVHPRAYVEGAVTLEANTSVWPMAVLRGDIHRIHIREGSNIQDGCVVHLADDFGVEVGPFCTVGHLAVIHACTIEPNCLIGIQATVLDGAVIGRDSIVGAQTLVTKHTRIPPGSLVLGAPGKVVRSLTETEIRQNAELARKYMRVAARHREKVEAAGESPAF
jgi:carbonic anhydrase/acetyltransferase-like protein (isoleucine patch superfamily)